MQEPDALKDEVEIWPAFTDLFSALSFILLLLVIVNIRQTRGNGSGSGELRTMRSQLLRELSLASEGGRLFAIDSGGAELRLALPDSLTFGSGAFSAAAIPPAGVQSVRRIARILADSAVSEFYSSINVVGHTDQVRVTGATAGFLDNWDLSARRAVSVARLLLESAALNPCLLRATGAGPFHPLDTAGARANPAQSANRRVSIVILPRVRGDDAIRTSCFAQGDGTLGGAP